MALYEKVTRDLVFPYGEENAAASFHKWMKDVFDSAYPVFFDKDGAEFEIRNLTKFPCIVVQQIDTQDLTKNFLGGKNNHASMLFYVYFNHSLKHGGTRRLLRRGRDQISTALKLAGVCPKGSTEPIFPPMYLWDFSRTPLVQLDGFITVNPGIQQRFIQEDDTLQHELMITLSYMEKLVTGT